MLKTDKTYSNGVHARQSSDSGGASQDQHAGDDNVGGKPEEQEDQVSKGTPSLADDLEESVGVGSIELELGSELGEEKNLDGSATSIPPRSIVEDSRLECVRGGQPDRTHPEIPYLYATAELCSNVAAHLLEFT